MPGTLITASTVLQCPHLGTVKIISENTSVRSDMMALATAADQFVVVGCPPTQANPKPCVKVQWLQPALRVFVRGVPVLVVQSLSLTDGAQPGPAVVLLTQARVRGI